MVALIMLGVASPAEIDGAFCLFSKVIGLIMEGEMKLANENYSAL